MLLVIAVVWAAALPGCRSDYPLRPEVEPWVTTESGLSYYDIRFGEGRAVESTADAVEVHYEGWLEDGTLFDSSRQQGETITFQLDRVIQGWQEGIIGVRVGGIRKLSVPPDLAYGERGTPGGPIPPNATLIFEVELLDVNPDSRP
jgi:FKBP-type peptidyl-prolyl cis-trans isomerase